MTSWRGARQPTPEAALDPWKSHTIRIREVSAEIDGVSTYDFAFQDEAQRAAYRFAPGQFNMLYLPGAGEIAISISEDPADTARCRHTIRLAGNVTRALARLPIGETLGLRGPFGTSWPLAECVGRDVVLVAGGIGLAPLRPVIYSLLSERRRYGRIHLLYGGRSPNALLYENEYADWASRGLAIQTTVDRATSDWRGNVGVVTLLLERLQGVDPDNAVLLVCGPEVMMKFTAIAARNRGMTTEQIWVSTERNMQCAVGLCGHCQLGPEFLCKDGPVFPYSRISPWMETEAL